jgi:hypothetical protein
MRLNQISLNGLWDFRLDEESDWRSIPVPGCWEAIGIRKDHPGPAWYRARFTVPASFAGRRLWLRFGAVSYHCVVFVDGQPVGEHIGMWDAFAVEITNVVRPGDSAELLVRVEKPASLTAGPDSAAVPGSFPLRETLAGFLPYVWGHAFGGIWQDVELIATGQVIFEDVHVRGQPDGRVRVEARLSAPGRVTLSLLDIDGQAIFESVAAASDRLDFEATIANPRPWSPRRPDLYTARLEVADGDTRAIRFGLRSIGVDGTTIRLNGDPIYPRLALSWGWYADTLHPNPGPSRVRDDLLRLKSLGYNGVKLCLWFPPAYTFDLADELGMLVWLELPMWLPRPTAFFLRQTPLEYACLLRQARNHPSVILVTLGCELNHEIGADILQPLYATARSLAGEALVRDNSGSGEAYGGLLDEFADTYDHHFYSDLQFLRGLLDAFAPRWRPEKPWLLGEFCDYDTFRNLPKLYAAHGGTKPWWTLADPNVNPQGARWQYTVVDHERTLHVNGLWDRGDELERLSIEQGLLHRKQTIELIRAYRDVSGYVVSGESDTPISTAGMWDDTGRLKFDAEAFRAFNQDLVVLIGWDRRRAWIASGDRVAYWDTHSYTAGSIVRAHLIASHYGAARGPARLAWQVAFAGEAPFASGEAMASLEITPGSLREVGIAEFVAPDVRSPRRAALCARVEIGDEASENRWPVWFFPRDLWAGVNPFALVDPARRLRDLQMMLADRCRDELSEDAVAIFTAWSPECDTHVSRGGKAILLQSRSPGPVATVEVPFWREAIKLVEPHPAWGDFPHENAPGLQFYGCATDIALDTSSFGAGISPIFRRLDARTMALHDYAVELKWGMGQMIVSTLRLEGGLGDQPMGISRNTAAAYLLACWLRYLQP